MCVRRIRGLCCRYLNDLDCEQQYNALGVAPLPLHGQVRPIKVEQESGEMHHWQMHDENHPHNLSSTPPILRRKGRKRDAEEERIEQVEFRFKILDICFLLFNNRFHLTSCLNYPAPVH